jgi:hypothetical protein
MEKIHNPTNTPQKSWVEKQQHHIIDFGDK